MATRNTRQYSDINLLFTTNQDTLDITKKYDDEAVKTSLKNLIQTKNYERPFHPEIGCQIFSLLFENFTPITRQVMRRTIFDVIEKFEPRVTVLDVKVRDRVDSNELNIELVYRLNNSDRPITLNTSISRVR
jgi:phage baseplate assembly protein W